MNAQLNYGRRPWLQLARPVCPAENFTVSQAMSALTRDGHVPSYEEAAKYAREQSPPSNEDMRLAAQFKYGSPHAA